jgi:predicted house-cleaning noncanonical NTP pyrophosphatase (MazG superfamily)
MGKLVRDRIPEIIRAQGRTADTRALGDDAYRAALLDKLVEEAAELHAAAPASALDEAADVYEVLLAIAAHEGWPFRLVAQRAAEKREERGGFAERVYLKSYAPTTSDMEQSP